MHIVGCVFLCPRNARVALACGSWRATNVARALRNRLLGPRKILLRGRSSPRAETHRPRTPTTYSARRVSQPHGSSISSARAGETTPGDSLLSRPNGCAFHALRFTSLSPFKSISVFRRIVNSRRKTCCVTLSWSTTVSLDRWPEKHTPDSDLKLRLRSQAASCWYDLRRSDRCRQFCIWNDTILPANCLSLGTPGRGRKPLGPGVVIIRRYFVLGKETGCRPQPRPRNLLCWGKFSRWEQP